MAAKVASLLIDIAADVAKVQKDFDKVSRSVEGFGAKIASMAKGLGAAFSVQQVIAYGEGIQASVDAMADLAENLQIPVEDFQALQNAALLAGQSIEATGAAMQKFTVFMGKAAEGGKEQIERLEALNVKILDLNGNMRPTTDLLQEVAESILAIENPAKRAAAEVAVFGRSGQSVSKILEQWAKGSKVLNEELTRLGLVHGPETVKAFADMADETDRAAKMVEVFFGYFYAIAKSNVIQTVAGGIQILANAINSVSLGSAEGMMQVIKGLALLGTGNVAGGIAAFKTIPDAVQVLDKQIEATGKSINDLEKDLEAYRRGGVKFAEQTLQTAGAIAQQQLALQDLHAKRDKLTAPPPTVSPVNVPGTRNPPVVGGAGVDKYAEALRKIANETEALTAAQDAYNKAASSGLPTAAAERLAKHLEDIAKKQNDLGKGLTPAQADDIDKRVAALAELQFAFSEIQRIQREGDAISRQYGDGMKELTETIYALDEARKAQVITETEYNNALAEANEKQREQALLSKKNAEGLEGIGAGWQYAQLQMEKSTSAFAMGEQLFTNTVGLMSSAIADFVKTGEINFAKLAEAFAVMLAQMAAEWAAKEAIKFFLKAVSSTAGGASGGSGTDVRRATSAIGWHACGRWSGDGGLWLHRGRGRARTVRAQRARQHRTCEQRRHRGGQPRHEEGRRGQGREFGAGVRPARQGRRAGSDRQREAARRNPLRWSGGMSEPMWTWCPMPGAGRETELKVEIADYGDGYTHRATRGLNPKRPKWSLAFPFTDLPVLKAMDDFLEAYAVPGFWFKPPDEDVPELFVTCDTWSVTIVDRTGGGARFGNLRAEFARAYNPQPIGAAASLGATRQLPPPQMPPQVAMAASRVPPNLVRSELMPVPMAPANGR